MTERTAIPRYVLWDHALHAVKVTTREQYLQADAEDQAKARELAERLADIGLVAVTGKFGHDGPPFFGTVMEAEEHESLLERHADRGSRPVGGLTYADIYSTANYAEGQLSRVAVIEQAMANGGIQSPELPEAEELVLA